MSSTTSESATQAPIRTHWRRLTRCPVAGSLIATISAAAASSVLPMAPQRASSTIWSSRKFAISSTSRLA